MRFFIFSIIFFLAAINIATAQVPTEKTLLWEVSGNGLQKPSYLFGTLHLICPSDLNMSKEVVQRFRTTKQLYLEVDMDDPNMMTEFMQGMQMHDGSTLQGLLKDDFDSVNSVFTKKTGLPLNMLNSAKPFMLVSMIYPSLLECQPVSLEGEFMKLAKDSSMEVHGLEFVADQVKVFEKIPYDVQASMLKRTLFNMDSAKTAFNEILQVYKQKDIKKMHDLSTSDPDFGKYENSLLNNRNQSWIPIIGEQAKKMPTFFAFGAGHLGGEEGVISLLRKNGFTVKPVMYKD
ncbi:TraB/GumN family protein [Aridibaculum aurantiacum]|uniref:TraB/GumN family protein n=1 Tax=Aridibaculum aurantiacum TaxID=2810307 RepID=UPI001A9761E3|nr:TraB/GumN family protein [Aridibaculum aurantiacum]